MRKPNKLLWAAFLLVVTGGYAMRFAFNVPQPAIATVVVCLGAALLLAGLICFWFGFRE